MSTKILMLGLFAAFSGFAALQVVGPRPDLFVDSPKLTTQNADVAVVFTPAS
jgi:hypothetical protein